MKLLSVLFIFFGALFQTTRAEPISNDPAEVCYQIGQRAQLLWLPELEPLVDQGTAEQMYPYDFSPWTLSMSVRPQARKAAFYIQLREATRYAFNGFNPGVEPPSSTQPPAGGIPDFHELQAYLTYFSEHDHFYSQSLRSDIDAVISGMKKDLRVEQIAAAANELCVKYLTPGCTQALRRALDIMAPRTGKSAWISMTEELREVITDSSYVRPMSIAALKVWSRVRSAESGGEVQGDILTDLTRSFLQAGYSAAESESRAWKVMGVYSSRGASWSGLSEEAVRKSENTPAFIPFFVISAGMNYLDVLKSDRNTFYSMPSSVSSSCKLGKPYHFWNAAYISHRLMNEGHGAKPSALAMHMSGEFYEMFSDTLGRNPYQIYRETTFSTHNHSLRMGVLFHALGAAFGVNHTNHLSEGDAGFQALVRGAEEVPLKTEAEINKIATSPLLHYLNWNKIISPDTAFQFYY